MALMVLRIYVEVATHLSHKVIMEVRGTPTTDRKVRPFTMGIPAALGVKTYEDIERL